MDLMDVVPVLASAYARLRLGLLKVAAAWIASRISTEEAEDK